MTSLPNDMDSFWMPFTANRQFKAAPRLLARAAGMYYETPDGRKILDGCAGLWCVNAGHAAPRVVEAIQAQAATMDYAPCFQMGHPLGFEFANTLTSIAPPHLKHAFFCNSGSEAVDTALKIAIAYWRGRGQGARQKLIGRERGYHGVGFGGISVGGIPTNRKFFGQLLGGVDHLPHTYDHSKQAFSKGQPEWGAHLADDLERLVTLHDASNIAAVIVEPMAGSTGVLIPPIGYLQRLREICTRHDILLIFDEVITAFGRLGAPFAASRFGVMPDMICVAKGLTNGAVPCGAVLVADHIYHSFMQGADNAMELFHGYTYSAHPLACAAGIATIRTYLDDGLFERAASLESYWQEALHSLRNRRNVRDIRNLGLVGAVELETRDGMVGKRAYQGLVKCFEAGLLIRYTGETMAFSPPLIIEKNQIDQLVDIAGTVIDSID